MTLEEALYEEYRAAWFNVFLPLFTNCRQAACHRKIGDEVPLHLFREMCTGSLALGLIERDWQVFGFGPPLANDNQAFAVVYQIARRYRVFFDSGNPYHPAALESMVGAGMAGLKAGEL